MPSDQPAKGKRRPLRIGKYEVIEHIASGGMGAVYKARDGDLGREVALKVLSPELAARSDMVKRFQKEARHAAKLRHENIVTIFDVGEANGTYFLALEFVDGIDLNEYIARKGKLDPEEARTLLVQAVKALTQVHKAGLVHRDIKPSNFLITKAKKGGQPLLKLTDLGLAREVDDEEFRVTRTGTTVGTVDYMSPEQARNSRSADIRSDIYSLGCTFFHMLTGKPPFAEGGLTERLYKHVSEEVPDVCRLNRKVPASLGAILRRMMEKDPSDRYQKPADLLKELERVRKGGNDVSQRDVLAALAEEEPAASSSVRSASSRPASPKPDSSASRPTTPPRRFRRGGDRRRRDEDDVLVGARPWWPFAAVTAGVLLVVLIAVAIAVQQSGKTPDLSNLPSSFTPTPGYVRDDNPRRDGQNPVAGPEDLDSSSQQHHADQSTAPKSPKTAPKTAKSATNTTKATTTKAAAPSRLQLPQLYKPQEPKDPVKVAQDFESEWGGGTTTMSVGSGPVFRVARVDRGGSGRYFETLAAACAAAEPDKETIIEIEDNGPLFEPAVAVAGRSLVLRGGKGYRPLLAWDTAADSSKTTHFLAVTKGDLRLQNLDIVAHGADTDPPGPASLLRVVGGSCEAWSCTFSVTGQRPNATAVLRFEGAKEAPGKVRFNRCYLRGKDLVALDLFAPGAQVLFDDCLVVGGQRPLLDVRAPSAPTTTLRIARSTLVTGDTFLHIWPAAMGDNPAVSWHGLDALLTRSRAEVGGALLWLDHCSKTNVKWQAQNCLYTGWSNLLKSDESNVAQTDLDVWLTLWQRKEGERAFREPWPEGVPADPSEASKEGYRPLGSRVQYAALSAPLALGCDVDRLPPARDVWRMLTYDRFVPPPYDLPSEGPAPPIPLLDDEIYQGERLDLTANKLDLGEYLQKMQEMKRLGPKVVLHLSGRGRVATSPIRIRGASLVLYFEPPLDETEPLELTTRGPSANQQDALVAVDDGNLEVTNGRFLLLNQKWAPLPRFLFQVRGGDLRLYGCRLTGPLNRTPDWYRGLIAFTGSGKTEADQTRECACVDSVLASSKCCIYCLGVGARVRLHNSVLVAGGNVLHLDPGSPQEKWKVLAALLPGWCKAFEAELNWPTRTRLATQLVLEHNTVAFQGALLRLGDAPDFREAPADPYVVRAQANVFFDPFTETEARPRVPDARKPAAAGARSAGLLAFEGEALPRGLLVWQGDGNVYDKELHYAVAPADKTPPAQSHTVWTHCWGKTGDVQALVADLTAAERKLDLEFPKLENLQLPSAARNKLKPPLPGSDLIKPPVAPRKPPKGLK